MPDAAANWLPTRRSLLKRLKDHQDTASWEDFCDSYGRVIHSVATKSGLPPNDAEDVTQETLLAVARHIGKLEYNTSKGSFKSWLLTIARSKVIDCIRRRERERRVEVPEPEDPSQTSFLSRLPDENLPDFEQLYDREWQLGLYEAARERVRQRISPQQYQIFDLYVVRQWPPEKVADTLEVTQNQVYIAKHRVSEAIRQEVYNMEQGNKPPACSP